ncbi:MAG: hypothetical protein ACLRIO_06425 [Butyricicoccus sp.]
MLQITQRRQEGTLIAVYTGELDHHAARAAIERPRIAGAVSV